VTLLIGTVIVVALSPDHLFYLLKVVAAISNKLVTSIVLQTVRSV